MSPAQIEDHPHHTLPDADFQALASGGGSPQVVAKLRRAEHSRRLIMLRALFDASRDVAPIGEAWAALERAEKQDAFAVATILMHPQVGAWLSYTLRRHEGGATSTAPDDHDFLQLNAVAIAASAATGQAYRATVPLRDGRALIPQFGMAVFADCPQWDVAEAGTEDGHLWLRHGDQLVDVPPGAGDRNDWWPLRRLTVGDDVRLTVWLDDLDPMRDLADPVPPRRLSPTDFQRWANLLDGAWAILVADHRPLAEAIAAGVTSLAPLPAGSGWGTRSASTGDAFGAIMCSPPPDAVTLAVSLAHEFTHIKLGGLMHLHTLTEGPGQPCLHAPWRDDPRPAGGLLQGIYAFMAIADFWRRQPSRRDDLITDFEYAYAHAQTAEALTIALRDGNLTERGRAFAEGIGEAMRDWPDDVDPRARAMARLVADAHRAGWRARHCHPRPEDVIALTRALADGDSGPIAIGPSEVRPDPEMRQWSAARLGLARRWLLAPERHAEARTEDWGARLTVADLALFAGEHDKAAAAFRDEITEDPESVDAWTGLGLALGDPALLRRPELVIAVHRASEFNHSPLAVAGLVGAHLPA
ncbi:HEXXH motif domain-containing protein [Paractinoplanes hotanensis]|uniref:HEXXH motif domain-containing protein n=1 Tax=Paractinoplanes hotanensis TaxID=2906497 RepID=A0ABT0Y9X5_9ACTN|nr:HEXXH motif domain-containing protein [Actinoplanes hotanensis]MCM4082844.1 HEXXH motif domain-containing protein [Actinoplanes hotanensis]